MLNYYLALGIFVIGSWQFCLKSHYLLLMLLSLEFIMLSLYFMLCIYFSFIGSDYFFLMIFLTLSVCEGSVGLSLLVYLVRMFGGDYLKSFNFLC